MTADCVVFGFNGRSLQVLLIERGVEPFKGYWALPGGFMKIDESIEQTARRELLEETGLHGIFLDQFKTYSRPDRDPRERVVTVAFIALVRPDDYKLVAGDDAANARWFEASMLPPLAFDHKIIVREAREYLKEILRVKPIAFELLNKLFSISELQTVYEVINEVSYDRRNFMRAALDSGNIADSTDPAIASNESRRLFRQAGVDDDLSDSLSFSKFESDDFACCDSIGQSQNTEPVEKCCQSVSAPKSVSTKKRVTESKASTKGLFDFLKPRRRDNNIYDPDEF